jgi:hypothetical protein
MLHSTQNVQVDTIPMRLFPTFRGIRKVQNNHLTIPIMASCLKYSDTFIILHIYYSIQSYSNKFRTFICTKYIRSTPLLYFKSWDLTSQVYPSSALLNIEIQKVWPYAALRGHNVTTKHR